ncbi:MAG: DNA repair protein RecN [Dermatophilaceae bacterium]
MLREIRLQHLGVIEGAEVNLGPGLTVLTGETGAGKTMLVTALGLVLGAKADAGVVRDDAPTAYVEASFDEVGAGLPEELAESLGIEGPALVLGRSISREGRSRAFVDGRTSPVAALGQLGEQLVAVHGQADQWRLRSAREHREVIDAAAGPRVWDALAAYRSSHASYVEARDEAAALRAARTERLTELDALRYGLEQVDETAPATGEDVDLRLEIDRLGNADALRRAAASGRRALAGDDDDPDDGRWSASALLGQARSALSSGADHDPVLKGLADRLAELGYLVDDVSADLAAYLAGLDDDPVRLAAAQDRLAALHALARRYGPSVDEVIAWADGARARVLELDRVDDRLAELERAAAAAFDELGDLAAALSAARRDAGDRFAAAVSAELAHLAMGSARVLVELTRQGDENGLVLPGEPGRWRFTRDGVDEVDIRLEAGSGAMARSVTKGASGGELSRVMLALELVSASTSGRTVPTMVFDEVDAGVGGKAALDVATRLAALARHTQVVVVTHLAQVAAFADTHLVVEKNDDGTVVASTVRVVSEEARLDELARMMSGAVSEVSRRHAAELLQVAARRAAH